MVPQYKCSFNGTVALVEVDYCVPLATPAKPVAHFPSALNCPFTSATQPAQRAFRWCLWLGARVNPTVASFRYRGVQVERAERFSEIQTETFRFPNCYSDSKCAVPVR